MSDEYEDEEVFIERPRDSYAERALQIAALMRAYEVATTPEAKAVLEDCARRLIATMEVKEPQVLGAKLKALATKP